MESLRLTPFARTEFREAYGPSEDPIERSRRLVIRAFMGFGSNAHSSQQKGHRSTGFRGNSSRSGTTPATDWKNYPDCLPALIERLGAVVIENRDARIVMAQHDTPATLHYVDPPYLPETRARGNTYDLAWRMYRHEMSRADHEELLGFVSELAGMVVLSGYADPLYDDLLCPGRAKGRSSPRDGDWRRVETETFADGARPRTEVLWLNPSCAAALDARPGPLFAAPAEHLRAGPRILDEDCSRPPCPDPGHGGGPAETPSGGRQESTEAARHKLPPAEAASGGSEAA